MRDELYDREYQSGRDALNDGIDKAVHAIGAFFATSARFIRTNGQAIHRFEFDAPWQVGLGRQPNQMLQRTLPPARLAKSAKRPRAA